MTIERKEEKKGKDVDGLAVLMLLGVLFVVVMLGLSVVGAADPEGPDTINVTANRTKGTVGAKMVNITGGNITVVNLDASVKNPRWKAFIGNVTGLFTLDDSTGATVYDWTLSSINGRVYATRSSGSITWSQINCSNGTLLESESVAMHHNNTDDNITVTFNATNDSTGYGNHNPFYVGTTFISANSCPNTNIYRNSASDLNYWDEVALYDNVSSTVYAAIISDDEVGYDGDTYDFQMIVPEDGAPTFSGATAYYIYLEIGS